MEHSSFEGHLHYSILHPMDKHFSSHGQQWCFLFILWTQTLCIYHPSYHDGAFFLWKSSTIRCFAFYEYACWDILHPMVTNDVAFFLWRSLMLSSSYGQILWDILHPTASNDGALFLPMMLTPRHSSSYGHKYWCIVHPTYQDATFFL